MFGKIRNVDDITAIVEIHKENMVVPNLMNLHVVFENPNQRLLGEVKKVTEEVCEINLMGQFLEDRFIAGTIKKPNLDDQVRVINDQELDIIIGSNKQGNLYLGKSAIYNGKDVYIDINDMFSNHLSIFGNTGSGKYVLYYSSY